LAAALAVVTFRARLVVALAESEAVSAGLERRLDTIRLLSRGRVVLAGAGGEQVERWEPVPVPEGREAWRAACADAVERGVHGVVVPADPRLLDILRNPEDPGERHDLQLAQG
jgi:hypothetical protein